MKNLQKYCEINDNNRRGDEHFFGWNQFLI